MVVNLTTGCTRACMTVTCFICISTNAELTVDIEFHN